jgi:hypothetical protein
MPAAFVDAPATDWGPPTTDPARVGPPPATPYAGPVPNPTMAIPVVAPEAAPQEPEASAPRSRPWGKYLPWIVAGIVVIVAVGVIRLTSSKSPDSLTPTTVTTTTSGANGSTTTAAGAESSTKTAYLTASTQMDTANAAATQGLSTATNNGSVPAVTTVMTQYQKGLQTFVFSVHGLHWTAATQASSEQLTLEIQTMVTYLSTVSSLDASTLHAWLTRFHSLAASIQTADNTVRGQLGIATTKSYPTA